MRAKQHNRWHLVLLALVTVLAGVALAAFAGAARAEDQVGTSDHQLAGLLSTGSIYVTGEPGYEADMWHRIVTPAVFEAITATGANASDIKWYVDALPGTIHPDAVPPPVTHTDHSFAGLLSDGSIYVTGEPGYEDGMWHQVTPSELAAIAKADGQAGAGYWDTIWYGDLPGTIHIAGMMGW